MRIGKKSLGKGNTAVIHDFSYVVKHHIWIFLLGLLAFLILIPFYTAGLPGDSIFNIEVTHDQLKFRLIHPQMIPLAAAAAMGMGLLAGMSLFGFVRDKRETTIFFSLGMTRTGLYRNRAAAGTGMLSGCTGIPVAVSLWLNVQALGGYQGLVRNALYLWAGLALMALCGFFAAATVSFLSGTLGEALVCWAGVMGTVTALCYCCNLLMEKLYWGNARGVVSYTGGGQIMPSLLEEYACFNPLLFFLDEMETHGQFLRPLKSDVPQPVSPKMLAGWALVCVALAVAAGFFLWRRKAEEAGIGGVHLVLEQWVVLLTGFLAFSLLFSFFYDYSPVMAAAMGMGGFYGVHIFWRRLLFPRSGRGHVRGLAGKALLVLLSAAWRGALVMLVCVVFHSGFFHSDRRFLEKGEIREAQISYVGAPGYLYEEALGSSTGRSYYIASRLSVKEEASMGKVKALQEIFINSERKEKKPGKEISDTVVPYDICFCYTDTKGKEHIWYYDRASYGQLEQMLSMEEEPEIEQKQAGIFDSDTDSPGWAAKAYQTGSVFLSDGYFTGTFQLTLSEEKRGELLAAVAEDLEDMGLQGRYFPEGTARAVLMFTGRGEEDCQYYAYHLNNGFLYLTPDYERTLAWLEENQLLSLLPKEPKITCVYLQKLDPYMGIHGPQMPMGMYFMSYCADTADEFLIQKDFGKKYTFDDKDEIQEIAAGLQNGCFMSRGGYLAAVKIKGQEKYRYLFLPKEKVPGFVR